MNCEPWPRRGPRRRAPPPTRPPRAVEPAVAEAALRAHRARDRRDQVQIALDEVRATGTLPLPRASWQQPVPSDGEAFAALVDFSPGLDDDARAGLEAACEAAGLLTAAVRPDGSVVTATGELLLVAAGTVIPNLSTVLVPVPDLGTGTDAIAAVLAAVGTGPASTGVRGAAVGVDRRQVRRRAAARATRQARGRAHRGGLPRDRPAPPHRRTGIRPRPGPARGGIAATRAVDDAAAAAAGAVRDAHRATGQAAAARSAAVEAERRAEQAWARAETTAAEHRLPVTGPELDEAAEELSEAGAVLRRLTDTLTSARRSLADSREAVTAWEHEQDVAVEAADEAEDTRSQAVTERAELTATEAALGDTEERVAAQVTELTRRQAGLTEELAAHRSDHTDAVAAASTARQKLAGAEEAVERAEAACAGQRDTLRAVLIVDGLLLAACDSQPEVDADVPGTVDGTARLVAAVREVVPVPIRQVDEDTLDRSLLQIRDALGAGWDAGSRRVGDGAPVAVEVSGPTAGVPWPQRPFRSRTTCAAPAGCSPRNRTRRCETCCTAESPGRWPAPCSRPAS